MNDMAEQQYQIGVHVFRFEPPDVFAVDLVGNVSEADMAAIGDGFRRATGQFYMLINAGKMGSFSTEAKKAIRGIPISAGIAVYGASTTSRVLLSLLNKVFIMVNRGSDNPVEFCTTEAEGRAWIDARRQELADAAGTGPRQP